MAIHIQCSSCGIACTAKDSVNGRRVKCPKCGNVYVATPTLDGRSGDTGKGRSLVEKDPFPILPVEFGRYRVLKLLGRGGMGAVYLAHDSQLDREVALKIPFFDAGSSPQRAERFVREARSAAALHHPNICTVFDAGQIDGRPFITMAYIAGTTLDAEFDPDAPMPQARAADIARKVAAALEIAHRKGIVHRDLKPGNVMLTPEGEPVVMDFGLAKRAAEADPKRDSQFPEIDVVKLTRDGGLIGTPTYMSPEQVRGDLSAIGPATDIYALGVMLFEMLTGHPPYTGSLKVLLGQIVTAPVPPIREFRPEIDARLEAICYTAMAKEPSARFHSMAAMEDALDEFLKPPESQMVSVMPAPPQTYAPPVVIHAAPVEVRSPFDQLDDDFISTPPKKRKKSRLIGLAVAVAVLAIGGLIAATVLKIETPEGTLVVQLDDPDTITKVKNGKLILSGPDGKDRYSLSASEQNKKLEAGQYKIRVEGADGLVLDTPEFTMKKGDKVTVRVTMEPKKELVVKKEIPNLSQDRIAAEYVLSIGGVIRMNDEVYDVRDVANLPRQPFRLTYVNFERNTKLTNAG